MFQEYLGWLDWLSWFSLWKYSIMDWSPPRSPLLILACSARLPWTNMQSFVDWRWIALLRQDVTHSGWFSFGIFVIFVSHRMYCNAKLDTCVLFEKSGLSAYDLSVQLFMVYLYSRTRRWQTVVSSPYFLITSLICISRWPVWWGNLHLLTSTWTKLSFLMLWLCLFLLLLDPNR